MRAGLSRKTLDGSRFRRPFHGVRIPADLPDSIQIRAQALGLVLPEHAAFSHETAALLCELPVPRFDGELDIMVPADAVVPQLRGTDGHTGLDPADVIVTRGVRVVHPERTFFHLASELRLDDLVALGDAALRRWCTLEQLTVRAADMTRRRGIVLARQALPLIRPGVDSAMETRIRLMIVRGGLPCPDVGVAVSDDAGGWLARPDLSYRRLKIAIEYDGDHHRTEKRQWRRDRARDENLREHGWIVITLTADDITRHPERTIARIWHYVNARTAALSR
jgi:hypothetical protein